MPSSRGALPGKAAHAEIEVGPNGLAKERLADIQRARLLSAMVEIASERGLTGATVAHVVAHAGVSRRTFYELFEDREGCFLAAFDGVLARASRHVLDAYDHDAGWAKRIRMALVALLSFLDREREGGRLLLVGLLGSGAGALERRQRMLAQLAGVVEAGRGQARNGAEPPSLAAEGVVGGALSIVQGRVLERERGPLIELTNPLMSMIVLPYLGPAAARRELGRPLPAVHHSDPPGAIDPLRALGMRLTYRTVRVLMSVAAAPSGSNREIGMAAGIADQGQISKLLGRLERLGLVRNEGVAPGKGAPNAWTLTAKGAEVERATAAGTNQTKPALSSGTNGRSVR